MRKLSKDKLAVLGSVISENTLDLLLEQTMPYQELMAYYKCAIMEVETKFRVLDQEFSLSHDRNPIETIKSR